LRDERQVVDVDDAVAVDVRARIESRLPRSLAERRTDDREIVAVHLSVFVHIRRDQRVEQPQRVAGTIKLHRLGIEEVRTEQDAHVVKQRRTLRILKVGRNIHERFVDDEAVHPVGRRHLEPIDDETLHVDGAVDRPERLTIHGSGVDGIDPERARRIFGDQRRGVARVVHEREHPAIGDSGAAVLHEPAAHQKARPDVGAVGR
jgi:hypothetical protein